MPGSTVPATSSSDPIADLWVNFDDTTSTYPRREAGGTDSSGGLRRHKPASGVAADAMEGTDVPEDGQGGPKR